MNKFVIVFCLCLIVVGCGRNAQPPSNANLKSGVTSTAVIKVTPLGASLAKGESGEAIVRLKIDDGYHVNANPPTLPYLIPTQLELTPLTGIAVDSINYPNAVTKKFSFSPDQALSVYEGQTDLKLRLTAAKTAPPGEHNLSVKLRVQACDDQVCYAPGTLDFTLPVTIK